MKIANGTLWTFSIQCFMAGIFTVLSLACFSMVYYFTAPEAERFVQAFKSETLGHWLRANFFGWNALWPSMFIGATVTASFIGFIAGIIAKVLHDRAKEAFKAGIVS